MDVWRPSQVSRSLADWNIWADRATTRPVHVVIGVWYAGNNIRAEE